MAISRGWETDPDFALDHVKSQGQYYLLEKKGGRPLDTGCAESNLGSAKWD